MLDIGMCENRRTSVTNTAPTKSTPQRRVVVIHESGNVQNMRKPNTTRMEKGIARRALTTGAMSESLPNIVVVIGKVASCATIVVAIASLPVCMKALLLFLNVYGHL